METQRHSLRALIKTVACSHEIEANPYVAHKNAFFKQNNGKKKSPRQTCHTCRSLLDPFRSAQKQMKWLFNRMYCIVITCGASHFSYLAREGVELLAVRQGQGWIPLSGGSTSESSCSLCCVPGFNDGFLIFCHLTGVCSALARTWRASRISSNVSVGWLFAGWASGYRG